MALNYKRLDFLLQYILAVAGQNDPYERELGMIHLIKYTYLADLAYARQHLAQYRCALETYERCLIQYYHASPEVI